MNKDTPLQSEVMPADDGKKMASVKLMSISALINNYTFAEIEKHDPGFVARMTASAAAHGDRQRQDKLTFAKMQAYTALGLQVIAGLVLLASIAYAVMSEHGNLFWTIIGLALFYGVAQSGSAGFSNIASSIGRVVERFKKWIELVRFNQPAIPPTQSLVETRCHLSAARSGQT